MLDVRSARARWPRAVGFALAGLLAGLISACCPVHTRSFKASAARFTGLPSDTAALIALSDELVELRGRTLRRVDRSLAALEKAREMGYPRPYELLWRLARGHALMAGMLTNKRQRLEYARRGGRLALDAARHDGGRVEAQYYLALNAARVAEVHSKLKYLKYFMSKAEGAARLDERFDQAGPLRFLGKLYITAPAWPVSVGSPEKGVEVLERAVAIAPVPANRLFLGQAYYHDEEYEDATRLITEALQDADAQGLELEWRREGEKYLRLLRDRSVGPQ